MYLLLKMVFFFSIGMLIFGGVSVYLYHVVQEEATKIIRWRHVPFQVAWFYWFDCSEIPARKTAVYKTQKTW